MTRRLKKSATMLRRMQLTFVIVSLSASMYILRPISRNTLASGSKIEANTTETGGAVEDYSKFRHDNPMHARMPCLLCHKRNDNSAKIKFSGHMPCAGCHTQQFAGSQSPMCTICHTETSVKTFPPLRSFNIQFDHGSHVRQTNCATCHKPSRRGVAVSVPSGAAAHATCFQCHAPKKEVGGRNIGSCSTCHQPGTPVRGSDSARAFSRNFSHQEHTRHNMNCTACHTVKAGASRGRQVSSPAPSMHFAPPRSVSCGGCHNDKRAFGTEDFSNCKRCHEGRSFKF